MQRYWIWLAWLKGIRLQEKLRLLQTHGDPSAVCAALPKHSDLTEADRILESCRTLGVQVIGFGDPCYPPRLRNIPDPPLVLYCKGQLPRWQAQPLIAIVGTRSASDYGMRTTVSLASKIAACGGVVVSGAAAGIDAAAMQAALDQGKPVVGVLACGLDIVYPAANRNLYRQTQEQGCLISQYPPGVPPLRGSFLQRNRIISGISDGVLVVEAPQRSGALNTARHALEQGRDLFAVPGNLDMDSCRGSNGLLQDGAYPVLNGWDVVKQYLPLYPDTLADRPVQTAEGEKHPDTETPVNAPPKKRKREAVGKNAIDNLEKSTYSVINKQPVGLSEGESAVLRLISPEPRQPDAILDACDLPSGTVQSILTRLAIKGLVTIHPNGTVSRK